MATPRIVRRKINNNEISASLSSSKGLLPPMVAVKRRHESNSDSDCEPPAKRRFLTSIFHDEPSFGDSILGASDKENGDEEMPDAPQNLKKQATSIFTSCVPLHYYTLEDHIRDEERLLNKKMSRFLSAFKKTEQSTNNQDVTKCPTTMGPMVCLSTTISTSSVTPSTITSVLPVTATSTLESHTIPTSLPVTPASFNFGATTSTGTFNFTASNPPTTSFTPSTSGGQMFNPLLQDGQSLFSIGSGPPPKKSLSSRRRTRR